MCALCGNPLHHPDFTDAGAAGDIGAKAAAKPALDLTGIIAQLRTSWGGVYENDTYPLRATSVQYAILTSSPNDSSPEKSGWVAMSSLMAARAAEAFEAWDDLIAINLTQYSGDPPSGAQIIQFGYSSNTDGGGTYEYPVTGVYQGQNQYGGEQWGITRAEIWLNSTWSTHSTSSAINQAGYAYYGGYGFLTYLHEIGHAMGLSHPGSYDASDGTVTYASDAEYQQDTHRYTVMSYFYADEDGSGTDHFGSTGSWRYPQTPMLDDVSAVQAIYGADTTTRLGDTIYGFHSTAGKDVYDFTKNANPIITIWDAGGNDTLDCSGFGNGQYGGQLINLTPGGWSNIGGYMTNNLAVAYNCTIENAIGGSGNDTIIGNNADNRLSGDNVQFSWGGNGAVDKLGDFNGDGKADIIQIEAAGNGKMNVWLSNGGSFGNYSLWGTGSRPIDKLGDFNGDGKTDVVELWDANHNAYVWLSNGGGFSNYTNWGFGFSSNDKIGDFNGDGRDDVIQLWDDNHTGYVWLSNGNGFNPYTAWGTGITSHDQIADFNGDGKADLIQLRDSDHNALVWLSNGTGFAAAANWGFGFSSNDKLGDFNGDGKMDMVQLWDANHTAYVWLSNGTGFTPYTTWGVDVTSKDQAADFNGDGKDDLIQLLDENHTAYVWLSNGHGFDPYTAWGTGVSSTNQIADFNGDGKADLIDLASNGNGLVWLSNGHGFDQAAVWGTGVAQNGGTAGNDTFVFNAGFGKDIITDFRAGPGAGDVIQFDHTLFANFAAVLSHTADDNHGNTIITYDANNTVTLSHVLKANLAADDFQFV